MSLEWLTVPDHLPAGEVDIVYAPSYGLTWDRSRLTAINAACVKVALRQANNNTKVILSCAYPVLAEQEARLKKELALTSGLAEDRLLLIKGSSNSYQEILKLLEISNLRVNINSILIVAEKFHLPRLIAALRWLAPNRLIYWRSVSARFEVAREPSVIKSIRAGYKTLWILWNILLYPLTPYLIKRQ